MRGRRLGSVTRLCPGRYERVLDPQMSRMGVRVPRSSEIRIKTHCVVVVLGETDTVGVRSGGIVVQIVRLIA